jgi:HK97 family phage prohead protease
MTIERRATIAGALRAASRGQDKVIAGYAAVFGVPSESIGSWGGDFIEKIDPHAFDKTLAAPDLDCRCLWNHDASAILGRTKSGTLSLRTNATGLFYECTLPDTQAGRDTFASVERGDVSGSSFGFQCIRDSWNDDRSERTLLQADLFDVSVVTFPAYSQTSVDVRGFGGKVERVKLGRYDVRSLRLPSVAMTDAERRVKARALLRELRADDDDDTEPPCECECDGCVNGNRAECDCGDDCEAGVCLNWECNCAEHRSVRKMKPPQGTTVYPGGLDPIARIQAQQLEQQIAEARFRAKRAQALIGSSRRA